MGFRDDISAIQDHLPSTPERQTMLFSATVPRSVQQIARDSLDRKHEFINCVPVDDSPVHAHVPQYATVLEAEEQLPHVLRLLAHDQLVKPGRSKAIVFLPTTRQVQLFATQLRELARDTLPAGRNTVVYELHSKRDMSARTRTSDAFRKDKSGAAVLVTSDVSARGVDYPNVTRVIQVGIPSSGEQYVHRVGRTGRGGSKEGRGDIVLLPWEANFVKYQLNEVPIRTLSASELTSEVTDLATQLDADPSSFNQNVFPGERSLFKLPYSPRLAEVPSTIEDLVGRLDSEAVSETMMSMLGFFTAQTQNLRLPVEQILEGIKEWTVRAAGLETPPYISPALLQRLGISDRPRKERARKMEASPRRSGFGLKSSGSGWADAPRRRSRDHDSDFGAGRRREHGSSDRGFRGRRERETSYDNERPRRRSNWREAFDVPS
jgi:ATP-dependent RNA helicase MSS116, mitochondrial